jgi:hypothetical protein
VTKGPVVEIDGAMLSDWDRFHQTFAEVFGFFDGYGRNMNAWIDCMGYMRMADRDQRLSDYHVPPGKTLTIKLNNCDRFRSEAPQLLHELLDCSAFVNGRELDCGEASLVAIAY